MPMNINERCLCGSVMTDNRFDIPKIKQDIISQDIHVNNESNDGKLDETSSIYKFEQIDEKSQRVTQEQIGESALSDVIEQRALEDIDALSEIQNDELPETDFTSTSTNEKDGTPLFVPAVQISQNYDYNIYSSPVNMVAIGLNYNSATKETKAIYPENEMVVLGRAVKKSFDNALQIPITLTSDMISGVKNWGKQKISNCKSWCTGKIDGVKNWGKNKFSNYLFYPNDGFKSSVADYLISSFIKFDIKYSKFIDKKIDREIPEDYRDSVKELFHGCCDDVDRKRVYEVRLFISKINNTIENSPELKDKGIARIFNGIKNFNSMSLDERQDFFKLIWNLRQETKTIIDSIPEWAAPEFKKALNNTFIILGKNDEMRDKMKKQIDSLNLDDATKKAIKDFFRKCFSRKNLTIENNTELLNTAYGVLKAISLPEFSPDENLIINIKNFNNFDEQQKDQLVDDFVNLATNVYKECNCPAYLKPYLKDASTNGVYILVNNDKFQNWAREQFKNSNINEEHKTIIINQFRNKFANKYISRQTLNELFDTFVKLYNITENNLIKTKEEKDISELPETDKEKVKLAYNATKNATMDRTVSEQYDKDTELTKKDAETGYEVFVQSSAVNNDKKVIISYRDTNDEKDLYSDWDLANNKIPRQLRFAMETYKEACRKYPDYEIIVTGHSLGGSMVELLCSTPEVEKHSRTSGFAFNSYGCDSIISGTEGYNDNSNVISIHAANDTVSDISDHVGTSYKYKTDSSNANDEKLNIILSLIDTAELIYDGKKKPSDIRKGFVDNAIASCNSHKLFDMDIFINQ